jgi:cold shock CspA family protein/biotin operon repressor
MKGTVKFFSNERGYGRLLRDDGQSPVAFTVESLKDFVREPLTGDRVEFDVEPNAKGRPVAVNLRLSATSSGAEGHPGKCFVVMPSGRGAEEARWFSGWYKMVIEEGVRAAGFDPVLSAAQDRPSAINDEIRAHLAFDPMVVVDLGGITSDAEPNPNVMYELGLRHALNLPVVLMAWANQRLPFDISNQRVIMERRDLLDVSVNRERLARFIQEAAAGNYYRPMDAVGRIATLERAETDLSPSSVLGALVREVRELKNRVGPRQRFSPPNTVKQALGSKAKRKAILERFLLAGGTHHQWNRVLQMTVERVGSDETDQLPAILRLAETVPPQSPPTVSPAQPATLSEDLLEQVRMLMPAQPWPTGSAAIVADKLGMSRSQVGKATQELIRRGVFLDQQEGVLTARTDEANGESELASPLTPMQTSDGHSPPAT